MSQINAILEFWFGQLDPSGHVSEEFSKRWWKKSDSFDKEISTRFKTLLEEAAQGKLNQWAESAPGCLALIILLDQFSRNIYRNSEKSFEQDAHALHLAKKMIESGSDKTLHPLERVFIYTPFEHAENKEAQKKCLDYFQELLNEAPPKRKKEFERYLDYAVRHKKIVDQFGRFPHRNEILGRTSTPEEIEFLKKPGSKF